MLLLLSASMFHKGWTADRKGSHLLQGGEREPARDGACEEKVESLKRGCHKTVLLSASSVLCALPDTHSLGGERHGLEHDFRGFWLRLLGRHRLVLRQSMYQRKHGGAKPLT